jgi:nucleotide-binding universal stress UspA family protein
MLRRILLLLGETPSSCSARQYAYQLAKSDKAELAGIAGVDLSFIELPMPGRVGMGAHKVILENKLKSQAQQTSTRLRKAFESECKAQGTSFGCLYFEGEPQNEICTAATSCDLMITGHDTAYRGRVYETLSEMLPKLLLMSPRPIVVCPDRLSGVNQTMIAFDGSLPAMRALQMFALLGLNRGQVIQIVAVNASGEIATRQVARAAKYLVSHGYGIRENPIASDASPLVALSDEIARCNIGTLVMGAYGHGRLRNFFFGSTTRTLIGNPPCALFLYH